MTIRSVDSIEDFFSEERENQEAAALKIPSWAGSIKAGDFFVRKVDVYGETLTIWSEVLPASSDEDEEGNEIPGTYEGTAYRFTRSFSAVCTTGELGDVHISTVERLITREEFQAARAAGWK